MTAIHAVVRFYFTFTYFDNLKKKKKNLKTTVTIYDV